MKETLSPPLLGIFGGTFDPIHLGHIQIAQALDQIFHFSPLLWIPCNRPLLKGPAQATAEQRLVMLRLALADFPRFQIETCELSRDPPSYTYDTLKILKGKYPKHHLCLLIGEDNYRKFHEWYHWQDIIKLAHLLVIPRLNTPAISSEVADLWQVTTDPRQLTDKSSGCVFFHKMPFIAISSTKVREAVKHQQSVTQWLDRRVLAYITDQRLYC